MVEAYQTSKGVGLIFPDEGKVRGPYTVRVMMTPKKTKTVIQAPNPASPMRPQRRTTLADARAYLRNKLGPLRKANPKKISKLIDEAEMAGEQWGSRHKARKGGRISQDVLYSMGRQYSGDVVGSEGPLPTGHRELVAMGYKTGIRRGLRNPSARDKFQVWGGVYGTEPIGKPKAAKSAVSAAIKHALSTDDRVTVRGNAPDAVLYIEKVSPSAVSVLVTREFRDLSRIDQSDVERMRGVVKRNPSGLAAGGGLYGGHNSGYSWIEWQRAILDRIPKRWAQPYYSLGIKTMPAEAIEVITNDYQIGVGPSDAVMTAAIVESLLRDDADRMSAATAEYYKKQIKRSMERQAKGLSRHPGMYPDHKDMEALGLISRTKVGKRNPAVSYEGPGLYKKFHGKPSTKTVVVKTIHNSRDDLANLGTLVEIKVDLATGQRATIEFPATGPDKVMLCSSPDGKQLYFVGGDQSLDLASMGMGSRKWHRDLMVLGIADEVTYRTRKGFDKFQLIDYYHELGEVTKKKPFLLYDTLNHELQIAGGQYEVKPEGIVN